MLDGCSPKPAWNANQFSALLRPPILSLRLSGLVAALLTLALPALSCTLLGRPSRFGLGCLATGFKLIGVREPVRRERGEAPSPGALRPLPSLHDGQERGRSRAGLWPVARRASGERTLRPSMLSLVRAQQLELPIAASSPRDG